LNVGKNLPNCKNTYLTLYNLLVHLLVWWILESMYWECRFFCRDFHKCVAVFQADYKWLDQYLLE
jgi:hypothetical protein